MKRPNVLDNSEIILRLKNLKNWEYKEDKLYAKFRGFETYRKTIEFVLEMSYLIEKIDHHPELKIGYNEVEVYASTHDPEGITMLDFQLAEEINKLFF